MKKTLIFSVLFVLTILVFANDLPNRRIFIEGTALRPDQTEYFLWNFYAEATGTGYPVTDKIEEAAYIFRFNVRSNIDRNIDNNLYVLTISLITVPDDLEVLSFDFFFSSLDEMYQYNRMLFLNAVNYIPPYTEEDLVIRVTEINELDTSWKDKWLYLRASFDYPITFYVLQPTGLVGGAGAYRGDNFDAPDDTMPLHHIINPMPGLTLGVELQFLDFMSFELNAKIVLGDTKSNAFINIAAGAEIKFPLKFFKHFVIAPYLAFSSPFTISPVFKEFPRFALGGGVQAGVNGGKNGSFFIDINFMFSFSKAGMHNQYGELFPHPSVIYYNRLVIGLGIGYKYGFIARKQTTAE